MLEGTDTGSAAGMFGFVGKWGVATSGGTGGAPQQVLQQACFGFLWRKGACVPVEQVWVCGKKGGGCRRATEPDLIEEEDAGGGRPCRGEKVRHCAL